MFEQMHGKKDIGSSRLRGHAVIRNWNKAGEDIGEVEAFKHGGSYDAVIFQKAYFTKFAKVFNGVKILDLCDPDWLDWGYPFKEMIELCDAVTCSSEALAKQVQRFTKKPVYFVPDRMELDTLPEPKKHVGETKSVVWFGYSHNFAMLTGALNAIKRLNLELIVVSNDVFVLPASMSDIKLTNYPWSQHHLADIQKADVLINPQSKKGHWKYKSDNKTNIGRALGLPVAHDEEELKNLLTEEQRKVAAEAGLKLVREKFDIKDSVVDYKEIISEINKAKNV